MGQDDYIYYSRRAEAEFDQARQASNPVAVAIHSQLAQAYRERVASLASDSLDRR